MAAGFVPVHSQSSPSGLATVSLNHSYAITTLGFAVLNDTLTFKNPGTASVQIPTVHLGIPHSIASRSSDLSLTPSGIFSLSQSTVNATDVLTLTPNQPTLAAGGNSTVAVKAIVSNILNVTASGFDAKAPLLVLLSPSLDQNVTQEVSSIILPNGGYFAQTPTGFTAPAKNATSPTFTMAMTGSEPSLAGGYLNFTSTSQTAWTPILVNSLTRTIVPSSNGSPVVVDSFSLHNVAAYTVASIKLDLLDPTLSKVKVIPNTLPPLVDTQLVDLSAGGVLTFASTTLGGPLIGLSNTSLSVSYTLPTSMMSASGGSVTLTIPTAPAISAPVSNYTIKLAPAKGVSESGQTSFAGAFDPFAQSTVDFSYSVSVGWAADQAIPAAALLFVVAFAMFAMQRPATKQVEEEKVVRSIADVLKAFETKTGLETQYMGELASAGKGSLGKTDFDRMRNEVSDLRSRAIKRLTDMRQDMGSGKQFDLLGRVADAEKEEDRAFRDLLNLYLQYHGNRMNDETFKRLLPNYRKRVEGAINHLSDLLHQVQTEER